ncbi:MAG TPA: cbb3-type cytochrome oxidase assembly protein CcoS [Roseococcus sp.]|nr:cbb3-type cytochrome oxidase assembly protein CcoS [Roseococcus sp.]
MMSLLWLLPVTLGLGAAGLAAYFWSVRSGQYDDLDAAAWRILDDEDPRHRPAPEGKAAESPSDALAGPPVRQR